MQDRKSHSSINNKAEYLEILTSLIGCFLPSHFPSTKSVQFSCVRCVSNVNDGVDGVFPCVFVLQHTHFCIWIYFLFIAFPGGHILVALPDTIQLNSFFFFFDLRPPHYFYLSMARPEGDTLPLRHSLISLLVLTWLSPQTCLLKAFRAVYLNQNDFFDTNAVSPKILISITSVYRSNYNLQFVWLFFFSFIYKSVIF